MARGCPFWLTSCPGFQVPAAFVPGANRCLENISKAGFCLRSGFLYILGSDLPQTFLWGQKFRSMLFGSSGLAPSGGTGGITRGIGGGVQGFSWGDPHIACVMSGGSTGTNPPIPTDGPYEGAGTGVSWYRLQSGVHSGCYSFHPQENGTGLCTSAFGRGGTSLRCG